MCGEDLQDNGMGPGWLGVPPPRLVQAARSQNDMLYVIVRYVLDVLEPPKVEILRTFRNIQLYIWLYIQLYIQPFFTSYIQRKRSRRNLGHFNLSFFCCNRTNDVTTFVHYERFGWSMHDCVLGRTVLQTKIVGTTILPSTGILRCTDLIVFADTTLLAQIHP
jgi:hypothetical protein